MQLWHVQHNEQKRDDSIITFLQNIANNKTNCKAGTTKGQTRTNFATNLVLFTLEVTSGTIAFVKQQFRKSAQKGVFMIPCFETLLTIATNK